MNNKRTAYFISDSTGITASALGKLLEHFPLTEFTHVQLPFSDTLERINLAKESIDKTAEQDGIRPIVIMSLGDLSLRQSLKECDAFFIDLFSSFIDPLGIELDQDPLTGAGIAHSITRGSYHDRMEAINFTLNHDDGITNNGLDEADVILIGVSRCGKTPTSIYLAMQFGKKAANYPLIPEDFERGDLPAALHKHIDKIFGLTIKPERLHSVRSERRPDSRYASLQNCKQEIKTAEQLMRRLNIPWADSTSRSIEELSAIIMQHVKRAGG